MKTQSISASRRSALPLSAQQEVGANRPVKYGLGRRGHYHVIRCTEVLTLSSLKPNVDQLRLKPTSSDRLTNPDIGLDHCHSNKLFSRSPYAMGRVRRLRFIRLPRVAEEDNWALAFRKLMGEGGSVVDHLSYLTVRRAGSLDGWVRVGTKGW